jgi:hypothetical protein
MVGLIDSLADSTLDLASCRQHSTTSPQPPNCHPERSRASSGEAEGSMYFVLVKLFLLGLDFWFSPNAFLCAFKPLMGLSVAIRNHGNHKSPRLGPRLVRFIAHARVLQCIGQVPVNLRPLLSPLFPVHKGQRLTQCHDGL